MKSKLLHMVTPPVLLFLPPNCITSLVILAAVPKDSPTYIHLFLKTQLGFIPDENKDKREEGVQGINLESRKL